MPPRTARTAAQPAAKDARTSLVWCASSSSARACSDSKPCIVDSILAAAKSARCSLRMRRRLPPCPHVTEQSVHGPHGCHSQNFWWWHLRGHFPTSFVDVGSHSLPPLTGKARMLLKRVLSPLHLSHSPHSSHSPNLQSVGDGPAHADLPHSLISARASLQALPPLVGCRLIDLLRMCSPPPQLALHKLHWLHSLSTQSVRGPSTQPLGSSSPGEGLHGQVWRRAPVQ
mmetsp:Transcript_68498/g.189586  ORF Transcript_68498/g.189586 Transcript_68498/m.189586 type:complete len:228 (+) Transcript_68498:183-866(+)